MKSGKGPNKNLAFSGIWTSMINSSRAQQYRDANIFNKIRLVSLPYFSNHMMLKRTRGHAITPKQEINKLIIFRHYFLEDQKNNIHLVKAIQQWRFGQCSLQNPWLLFIQSYFINWKYWLLVFAQGIIL